MVRPSWKGRLCCLRAGFVFGVGEWGGREIWGYGAGWQGCGLEAALDSLGEAEEGADGKGGEDEE